MDVLAVTSLGEEQQAREHDGQPPEKDLFGAEAGHQPGGDPEGERGYCEGLRQERQPGADRVVPEDLFQVQRAEEEHPVHAGHHDRAYGARADEATQSQDPRRNERVRCV